MSQRDRIKMSDEEAAAFLDEQRVVICATNGPRGWPHLMPLWYVPHGTEVWGWTYGSSQKVVNLERDPRVTLQVEAGDAYGELRGVMIEAETVIHHDPDRKLEVGMSLARRYGGGEATDEQLEGHVRGQLDKRVALQFVVQKIASWDHRKL